MLKSQIHEMQRKLDEAWADYELLINEPPSPKRTRRLKEVHALNCELSAALLAARGAFLVDALRDYEESTR